MRHAHAQADDGPGRAHRQGAAGGQSGHLGGLTTFFTAGATFFTAGGLTVFFLFLHKEAHNVTLRSYSQIAVAVEAG